MQRAERGFTLLEVLLAFLILSVSLAVLYRGAAGSLQVVDRAQSMQTAVMLAQSKLETLDVTEPLGIGETEGTFENEAYRWVLIVKPFPALEEGEDETNVADDPADSPAYDIELKVKWDALAQENEISINTLRLAPLDRRF